MPVEPLYFLFLLCVAFCSSILGALSGFGGGLMVTPFLIPAVGVKGVVPVISIAMVLGNLGRLWVYRSEVNPKFLARIIVAVIPGTILGTFIYDWLPPRAVAILIGSFLILSVPLRWALRGRPINPGPAGLSGLSFGFGVLTGSTPGAGVILLSILLGMGLSGPALIGTDAVVGVTVNLVKALMFGTFDLLTLEWAAVGLVIGLTMLPGAYAARWLLRRLPLHVHLKVIEGFVVLAGLSFFWTAYTG